MTPLLPICIVLTWEAIGSTESVEKHTNTSNSVRCAFGMFENEAMMQTYLIANCFYLKSLPLFPAGTVTTIKLSTYPKIREWFRLSKNPYDDQG
jgi:hypothetical protein